MQEGNIDDLENMLAEEAILYSDGGGKVTAARKPIFGPNQIARFMVGINKDAPQKRKLKFWKVNGKAGLVLYLKGHLHSVWSFYLSKGKIHNIFAVVNPDKLDHLKTSELKMKNQPGS